MLWTGCRPASQARWGGCGRTPEGDIDYESPLLLDMDLLDDTFT
ncbi:hypothetical protein NE579_15980 [Intestinimonas massiliensis]|uniref:Uncharacterized protein n=1 Tax=Intestinimonas massiliensis (ex Afouda et al. 2020) TaxID=1673721 RepID=A0AAW5JQ06_9FIRM|nr:hypothetical protein [Intestinimonas massiliensis (ex Afouda et al. 2020)]MCQ4771918.1 hypothetical protein [Intestinimonas massiliensis (ex Afouda et al. 2020)]